MDSVLHSNGRARGKDGVFAKDVARILGKVFEEASRAGIGRKGLARRFGAEPRLFDVWCAASHPTAITSADLLALMSRDDVLPDEARAMLVREVASMAGFVVREDIDADSQPAAVQVVEICAALGDVSKRLSASRAASSMGGARLDPREAAEVVKALEELTKQADELKAAMLVVRRRV